jgi:hypothetical protein
LYCNRSLGCNEIGLRLNSPFVEKYLRLLWGCEATKMRPIMAT